MRFYECLIGKCIPIVDIVEETYRSKEESNLDNKYYLSSDYDFVYREDWVEHNYNIFLQYHTLEYFYPNIHIFGMRRSRLHFICDVVLQHYKNYKFYTFEHLKHRYYKKHFKINRSIYMPLVL